MSKNENATATIAGPRWYRLIVSEKAPFESYTCGPATFAKMSADPQIDPASKGGRPVWIHVPVEGHVMELDGDQLEATKVAMARDVVRWRDPDNRRGGFIVSKEDVAPLPADTTGKTYNRYRAQRGDEPVSKYLTIEEAPAPKSRS
jgi:hypothetical protein